MKITMTAIIERQRERLYTQKAKNCEIFLYTKSQTLFKKLDNFRYVFIYKNLDTSQKARQFAIRFNIQKSGTFALPDFSLNF